MGLVPHWPLQAGAPSRQPTAAGQSLPSGGVHCPVRRGEERPPQFQGGCRARGLKRRVGGECELPLRASCVVLHTPGASHESADRDWPPGEGDQPWSGLRTALLPQTTHPLPLCGPLWDCWWVEEVVFLSWEGFDSEHCIIQ